MLNVFDIPKLKNSSLLFLVFEIVNTAQYYGTVFLRCWYASKNVKCSFKYQVKTGDFRF